MRASISARCIDPFWARAEQSPADAVDNSVLRAGTDTAVSPPSSPVVNSAGWYRPPESATIGPARPDYVASRRGRQRRSVTSRCPCGFKPSFGVADPMDLRLCPSDVRRSLEHDVRKSFETGVRELISAETGVPERIWTRVWVPVAKPMRQPTAMGVTRRCNGERTLAEKTATVAGASARGGLIDRLIPESRMQLVGGQTGVVTRCDPAGRMIEPCSPLPLSDQ